MLSREQVRNAVLGRADRPERRAAVAMLLDSDDPEREAVLAAVASNARERLPQRSAAAIALGHIRSAEAERLLQEIIDAAPPSVAAEALRSLGRIGGPGSIEAIEAHLASAEPVAAAARYAAGLIAHRFRLPTHGLPVPAAHQLLEVRDDASRPMDVGRASAGDARAVLESVGREAYGIDVVRSPLMQLRCGTDAHVLCVNRELAAPGAAASLLKRKALLALALLRSREASGYSVSYVVLAQPPRAGGEIRLLAPRCSGRPALAGSARLSGERLQFRLRAIDRPGARPYSIDGVLELSAITITRARIGTTRNPAPAPLRQADEEPSG